MPTRKRLVEDDLTLSQRVIANVRLLRPDLIEQGAIADALGIERTTISRYENGKQDIRAATLRLIASRLGTTEVRLTQPVRSQVAPPALASQTEEPQGGRRPMSERERLSELIRHLPDDKELLKDIDDAIRDVIVRVWGKKKR